MYFIQKPTKDLLLHSDLGSQYTSHEFMDFVQSLGMTKSFIQKGCPYVNACIESFHAILKKEEVNHVQYLDYHSASIGYVSIH